MRVYHCRYTMNLKSSFALLLTILVIVGYSFYRYFYRYDYPIKPNSTASRSNDFESAVHIKPTLMGTKIIKFKTTPQEISEKTKQREEGGDIDFLPMTESEKKAKKEFFEHLQQLSTQQEMNASDSANEMAYNETLLNEDRMDEYDLNVPMNSSNTVREETKWDEDEQLDNGVQNTRKKNAKVDNKTEMAQQNWANFMSNQSQSLNQDSYNVPIDGNGTVYDRSSRGLASLNGRRGRLAVDLRRQKERQKIKKNYPKEFKQKLRSKVQKRRHYGTKKPSLISNKRVSLPSKNIHYQSSLHNEGHDSKAEQHESIYPNKKMLTSLKTNLKIEYREGYVFGQTFFREAKLKPVYNSRNLETSVLLLHPSIFTSSVWVNIGTMQALAESGYRNVAVDLPGYGRSKTTEIPYSRNEIIDYMIHLLRYLSLDKPVIVTPSRSGEYVMPLIMSHPNMIGGFVAISPTDTGKYSRRFYENLDVPSLVVLGRDDTSMLNWASLDNLEHLKVRRIFTIANTTKECYVNRPSSFHKLLLEFLPSVAKYA